MDIWSFGCIMYELLVDSHPWCECHALDFSGQRKYIIGHAHRQHQYPDRISTEARLIIEICLQM
jgi:serine/threonine protein kinase